MFQVGFLWRTLATEVLNGQLEPTDLHFFNSMNVVFFVADIPTQAVIHFWHNR